MEGIKETEPDRVVETVADRGYEDTDDMLECLEEGILPHVITKEGTDGYGIELPYEEAEADVDSTKPEELKKAKEGYFARDPEQNLVYCPAGEILRQKCIKKKGNIRYASKNACRHCKNRNKCYKGKNEWKEID